MQQVGVIDRSDVAGAVLDPLRARILAELATPGSASTLATSLGESRQKINYHLRALEELGLATLVEERPRRGLTERILQATAHSFVISPSVLGAIAAVPERTDRLSAAYLLSVASRLIDEVGALYGAARDAGKTLPTLTIDTDVRFATAAQRAAFTEELVAFVADLSARYHDETAEAGRWHRLMIGAHPRPVRPDNDEEQP